MKHRWRLSWLGTSRNGHSSFEPLDIFPGGDGVRCVCVWGYDQLCGWCGWSFDLCCLDLSVEHVIQSIGNKISLVDRWGGYTGLTHSLSLSLSIKLSYQHFSCFNVNSFVDNLNNNQASPPSLSLSTISSTLFFGYRQAKLIYLDEMMLAIWLYWNISFHASNPSGGKTCR